MTMDQEFYDQAVQILSAPNLFSLPKRPPAKRARVPMASPPSGERGRGMTLPAGSEGLGLPQLIQALRAKREESGLSLNDLRETSGISRARLSRIENQLDTNPTVGTLDRIAEALGLRLLLTLAEAPEPANNAANPAESGACGE